MPADIKGKILRLSAKIDAFRSALADKSIRRVIAAELGKRSLKICYLELAGQKVKILNYKTEEIFPGADYISSLKALVFSFLSQYAIEGRDVYVSISDIGMFSFKHIIIPAVPKNEIRDAVLWQLKSDPDFNDAAIFDWQLIKEGVDKDGVKKIEIMGVFTKSETINSYLEPFSEHGLIPVYLSCTPFVYQDILGAIPKKQDAFMVLNVGEKESWVGIYNNNKLNFIRELAFSTEKIIQSLTGVLAFDQGKVEITPGKAASLKDKYGIPMDEGIVLDGGIKAIHIISLMRPVLEGLVKELNRSVEYYRSSLNNELKPPSLFIMGDSSDLNNLDLFLRKELNIDVTKLESIPLLESPEPGQKQAAGFNIRLFPGLIGTVLNKGTNINLLPSAFRTKKLELLEKSVLRITGVILSVVFITAVLFFNFQIKSYRKRIDVSRAHLNAVAQTQMLKQRIDARQSAMDKIRQYRVPVYGICKLISSVVPDTIILTEVSLDQSKNILVIKGNTPVAANMAEPVILNFVEAMEKSSFISEASLAASENKDGIQEFEIRCILNNK
ncbi:MAG: hypothetical protein C4533_06265 [Candidatus Omnitrophota bacterium]|jgi:Tfp pilus assembly PilM family ATPase|nr:MAG: hypothetical protein C4533_06265 [Candidatus Omnitrophota bacterium]